MDRAKPAIPVRIVKLYDGRKYTQKASVPDKTETRLWVMEPKGKPSDRTRFQNFAAEIFGDDWVSMGEQVQIKFHDHEDSLIIPETNQAFANDLDKLFKSRDPKWDRLCVFLFPVEWDGADWNGDMDVVSVIRGLKMTLTLMPRPTQKSEAFRGGGALKDPPNRRTGMTATVGSLRLL